MRALISNRACRRFVCDAGTLSVMLSKALETQIPEGRAKEGLTLVALLPECRVARSVKGHGTLGRCHKHPGLEKELGKMGSNIFVNVLKL